MSAWRTGLLRSTMRYGFLMRAPNRTTGDLRWVVTETNKQHAVVTSRIDVVKRFVLPGVAVVSAEDLDLLDSWSDVEERLDLGCRR